ncbi:MAG TPA: class I SAM-dependent methyltransferase [Thermoanaerobaculia bacterium]|nr:class I SAM-dependent methyltransferase [Thermoanaerobaculia bacterium]
MPLPRSYDVVGCLRCGMVYADTAAPQADYDRYYARFSRYEDPSIATGGLSSARDTTRFTDLAEFLAARVATTTPVLDVGCAGGGLLAALSARGFQTLHGVDGAAGCVDQVRAMGFTATCLAVSELRSWECNERFGLVVISHVLEHVVDARGVLAGAGRLAETDGLIYVETPDASRYSDFDFAPFYFFDTEHINHFDPGRLARLGAEAGFDSMSTGTRDLEVAPGRLYPAGWAVLRPGKSAARAVPRDGDQDLIGRVAAYVERCRNAAPDKRIETLAASGRPVVVWGAGSFAQRLFADGEILRCRVVAVVDRDRNKRGRLLSGFRIESPEEAFRRITDAVILVAAAVDEAAIVAEARTLSPESEILTLAPPRPPDAGIPGS